MGEYVKRFGRLGLYGTNGLSIKALTVLLVRCCLNEFGIGSSSLVAIKPELLGLSTASKLPKC